MELLGGYSSGEDAGSPSRAAGKRSSRSGMHNEQLQSCKDRTDKRALYADPPQDLGDLPKPADSAVQQAKTVAAARPSVKLTGPRPARVFKVPLNVKALIESDDEVSQPCSVCSSAVILAVRLL